MNILSLFLRKGKCSKIAFIRLIESIKNIDVTIMARNIASIATIYAVNSKFDMNTILAASAINSKVN